MILYCYSTYKFSPVGFSVGYVNIPIGEKAEYTYLKPCTDSFVKKCFEKDIIRRVYGKRFDNGHYCFMVKGLKCDFINEDNVPSHKKGNFLFEFSENELEKYKRFTRNYKRDELEKAMNDFIIPDSFAEKFALKIQTKKLNEYIEAVLSGNANLDKNIECDDLYFHTMTSNPDNISVLTDIAGCAVSGIGEQKYSTKKKSLVSLILQIPEIVGMAVRACLDFFASIHSGAMKIRGKIMKKK